MTETCGVEELHPIKPRPRLKSAIVARFCRREAIVIPLQQWRLSLGYLSIKIEVKITANMEEEINRAEFEERSMANVARRAKSTGLTKQLIKYKWIKLETASAPTCPWKFLKTVMAYIFLMAYWQYIKG